MRPDPDLVLGNPDLSLSQGGVLPWQKSSGTAQYRMAILEEGLERGARPTIAGGPRKPTTGFRFQTDLNR